MNLKGATINIYNKVTVSDTAQFIYSGPALQKVIDNGQIYEPCSYYTLSAKPVGYDMDKTTHLPYFATVTEDLPGWCKWNPKVYERCQLTTDFPGGYLVFEDLKTKERLKIAMNSYTYEPIN